MDIITIYVVAIIATLSLGVMVHELGHCIGAKLAGVHVEYYNMGVGPTILKFTDSQGTVFNLKLFPLGGFTKLLDGHDGKTTKTSMMQSFRAVVMPFRAGGKMAENGNGEGRSFQEAKPARKLFVALAGSGLNFLVAFAVVLTLQLVNATQSITTIDVVSQDTKAYTAGLRSGDRIIGVDGVETSSWQEIGSGLFRRIGDTGTLELNVMRDGQRYDYGIPIQEWQSDKRAMAVFDDIGIVHAVSAGTFTSTGSVFGRMIDAVVETFTMGLTVASAGFKMIFGEMSILNFFGSLQLLQLGEDGNQLGNIEYAKLFALFFIALGIINLLPGPIVDGNAATLSLGEWITGIYPTPRVQMVTLVIGAILGWGPLVLCITYEIMRSFG